MLCDSRYKDVLMKTEDLRFRTYTDNYVNCDLRFQTYTYSISYSLQYVGFHEIVKYLD